MIWIQLSSFSVSLESEKSVRLEWIVAYGLTFTSYLLPLSRQLKYLYSHATCIENKPTLSQTNLSLSPFNKISIHNRFLVT